MQQFNNLIEFRQTVYAHVLRACEDIVFLVPKGQW